MKFVDFNIRENSFVFAFQKAEGIEVLYDT